MALNLLYANDQRGQYPQSWYAATATPLNRFAPLKGATKADVCVIGGGYTGLSAALHLAEAGRDVMLLEAQRLGFGASGRNGGSWAAVNGWSKTLWKKWLARIMPAGSGTWGKTPRRASKR